MDCTLYIPYSIGDPEKGFQYHGGENLTDRRYIQLVVDDYNSYKDTVSMMVDSAYYGGNYGFRGGLSNNNFKKTNFMSKYDKNGYTHQDYEYYTCECKVFDMYGKDENIDNLLSFYKACEQFIIIIQIEDLTKNPDLETEFKMWVKESSHINKSTRLSDEEKIYNLPKKDMKIAFKKAKSSAILKECKIIEVYNSACYAVLVNKIVFIRK